MPACHWSRASIRATEIWIGRRRIPRGTQYRLQGKTRPEGRSPALVTRFKADEEVSIAVWLETEQNKFGRIAGWRKKYSVLFSEGIRKVISHGSASRRSESLACRKNGLSVCP